MIFSKSRRSANVRIAMKPSSRTRLVPIAVSTKAAKYKTSRPDATFFCRVPSKNWRSDKSDDHYRC
jgi:hypothetical protein